MKILTPFACALLLCAALGACDESSTLGTNGADMATDAGGHDVAATDLGNNVDPGDAGPDADDSCGDGECQAGEEQSCPEDCGGGPEASYPVVDTDLANCFAGEACTAGCPAVGQAGFGQDAQYVGAQPDYQDNGDGTVTDLQTGLMWARAAGAKVSWSQVVPGAATFDLAGYDDWRLPTIKELYSLIVFSGLDPSGYEGTDTSALVPFIDTDAFDFEYGDTSAGERIIDAQYWSSTEYVSTTMNGAHTVFGVNLADGRIKGYPSASPGRGGEMQQFVKYVRGGSGEYGSNDFTDLGDGVIHDQATGLMWAQADSGEGMQWEDALAYCEDLGLGGHDDWRLPDVKELQSIVDYSRSPDTTSSPAIDPLFAATAITNEAGQQDWGYYWSTTTHMGWSQPGASGAYVCFGRCMGYMNGQWIDVHGAGAQRSDPKSGDPAEWPTGHGPQGDAIRIDNFVRCVRGGVATLDAAGPGVACPETVTDPGGTGPTACTEQSDCEVPDACPPEAALGCACSQMPNGLSACVPKCVTDQDCPAPPEVTLMCSPDGVCVPQGGPGPR